MWSITSFTPFSSRRSWHGIQIAALELAELQGKVVPRDKTEEYLYDVLAEARMTLATRWAALSAELEGMTAQEIEARGTDADEAVLTRLADRFEAWRP